MNIIYITTYVVVVDGKRVFKSVAQGTAVMYRNAHHPGATITTDVKATVG